MSSPMRIAQPTSPLMIAVSVAAGILLVIGIMRLLAGIDNVTNANSPIADQTLKEHGVEASGDIYNPFDRQRDEAHAKIAAQEKGQLGMQQCLEGGAFMLPILALGVGTAAYRSFVKSDAY